VFAVPQRQVDIYHTLATFIEGSTVGVLTDTSGNVVDLIRSNYEVQASIDRNQFSSSGRAVGGVYVSALQ